MDVPSLTPAQYKQRWNIRNFLLTATREELHKEKELSINMGNEFRAACVQELIDGN